jgi:hypothetical protein
MNPTSNNGMVSAHQRNPQGSLGFASSANLGMSELDYSISDNLTASGAFNSYGAGQQHPFAGTAKSL